MFTKLIYTCSCFKTNIGEKKLWLCQFNSIYKFDTSTHLSVKWNELTIGGFIHWVAQPLLNKWYQLIVFDLVRRCDSFRNDRTIYCAYFFKENINISNEFDSSYNKKLKHFLLTSIVVLNLTNRGVLFAHILSFS